MVLTNVVAIFRGGNKKVSSPIVWGGESGPEINKTMKKNTRGLIKG